MGNQGQAQFVSLTVRTDASDHGMNLGQAKYKCSQGISDASQTRYGSKLWKGLRLIWSDIRDNLVWNVANGQRVNFWYDNWIVDLGPLVDHLVTNRFVPDYVVVASMVNMDGDWN
ncbi:hypothetical protein V6N13_135866 [Hibiscus sabdariffa]